MSESRTLSFPADTSLGQLVVGTTKEDMQQLEARGEVEVPTGAQAMLQMSDGADPQGLMALPSDALVQLSCRSVPSGGLGPVARQTGLKSAVLYGEFTDEDVTQLASMRETAMLILGSDQLTGSTLGSLSWSETAYLSVASTGLTPEGVTAALSLRVDGVTLHTASLPASVLDAVPTIAAAKVGLVVDELDVPALVRLIERSPALTSVNAVSSNDRSSFLDDATVLALRLSNPALTIDGIWYDEKAVQKLAAGSVSDAQVKQAPPADPVELTVDNFDELIAGNTPVLVDFTAVWCGPCKALKPTIHELTGELAERLLVGTLDIDEQKPIAERYGINAVPTLLVFRNGAQVARIASQNKDEILAQLAPVL